KVTLWLFACVLIVGAAVLRLRGNAGAHAESKPLEGRERVIPVIATTVDHTDLPIELEGLGSVVPIATVTIRSQVDGRLDKMFFREGQAVKKGELLAQIDPRAFQIQLHQAEGSLRRDRATLESGGKSLERLNKLIGPHFVAPQDVQNQEALVGGLEGTVYIDEAAVESAKLNITYSHITSPIDGVTGIRLVDPGNLVRASDTTGIVIVTQLDPIAVVFTLPQDDLPKVAEQLAHGAELEVDAYDRSGITKLATGQLQVLDNQVATATASIRLKAFFPNGERRLWPNLFVKARLHLETRKGVLAVPSIAVQRGPRGALVYVIKSDQTAEARPIEVELQVGELTVIKSGLQAGEQVVVEGQNQLRPGAKVSVRKSSSALPNEKQSGALR
ncbi:MAG: mdtA, partial [Myxococcaceae bacterium]|nr:mdtA [Myxococcaceae bacterium]